MTETLRFIDLFCGIGGFRLAMEQVCREQGITPEGVFSSDIDPDAQATYAVNFGEQPAGDITQISAEDIPDHDLLFAGFPCQPFSIMGDLKGFEDARGTLFFEIARILEAKRPRAFVLENVKQLRGHDGGRTLTRIMETLRELGYQAEYRVLNALNFGLPQKRERVIIVGFREPTQFLWSFPTVPMTPLSQILESEVDSFYYASDGIRQNRLTKREGKKQFDELTIWHENKGGNVSAYPYSCALRAGASYNYLLVDGERRLTEREQLRLQGFPDWFQLVGNYTTARKLTGNAVPVPMIAAVLRLVVESLYQPEVMQMTTTGQLRFLLESNPPLH
jgi:DNA (cytosine-5)-methyltransferase 1